MSIENPTLAHFRHFWHFSSLFTNLPAYKAPDIYVPISHLATCVCQLSSALYICREISTNQPFLCKTNPILSAVGGLQMNLNSLATMNYQNFIPLAGQKNKPNSNPIQSQSNPISKTPKMSINSILTKDYERNDIFTAPENKPNSNPNKACPERSLP